MTRRTIKLISYGTTVEMSLPSWWDSATHFADWVTLVCAGGREWKVEKRVLEGLPWFQGQNKVLLKDHKESAVRLWIYLRYGRVPCMPISFELFYRLRALVTYVKDFAVRDEFSNLGQLAKKSLKTSRAFAISRKHNQIKRTAAADILVGSREISKKMPKIGP